MFSTILLCILKIILKDILHLNGTKAVCFRVSIEWQITRRRTRRWRSRFPLRDQFRRFPLTAGFMSCIATSRAGLIGTCCGTITTGFGSITSDNFWMGLDRLHYLTTSGSYLLRLEWQQMSTGYWFSVEYWRMYIENEAAYYKLHVKGYVPGDDGRILCVCETAF